LWLALDECEQAHGAAAIGVDDEPPDGTYPVPLGSVAE
jgi:hypothetical protein